MIGERDPTRFDWKDCLDLVTNLVQRGLAPRTVKAYIDTLKLALDFAGVEPNPARDRRVKLPRQPAKQPRIPSRAHIQAIRTHLPQHLLIPFDTLEATGIRVGELNNLTWADLDTAESRARIAQGKTASARRWVQLPPTLTHQINATRPPGDIATEHRLFPRYTNEQSATRSAKPANTPAHPHYHPHDLRDRWISLALKRGMPPAEVARDAGHARQAITLDTYSHVITDPDDHHPLAWETYEPRTDTTPTSPQPNTNPETRGPRADTTATQ